MGQAVPVWGVLVGAVVLCVLAGYVVGRLVRAQHRLQAEVAALQRRSVEPATKPTFGGIRAPSEADPRVLLPELQGAADFLITTAGTQDEEPFEPVPATRFVSLAAGESLVRLVSLGHGLRRALSAQNRNRIAFEVRREVRRSRKRRRRELKQTRRGLRGAGRRDAA